MSDELNKEMDDLEEVEEATAEPTGVKAKEPGATSPKSVKLKQEKENMAKEKGAKSASDPKATKGVVKPVTLVTDEVEKEDHEEEEEEVKKEEKASAPKLKSEIMQGLVDHIKGLKKEDLAKMYGTHILGETEKDEDYEEEEDENEEEEDEAKPAPERK